MTQQVTITSTTNTSLKPLVETAIRRQLKALRHGIQRTKERLAEFEQQSGLASMEFERRLKAGEMEESLETIDWRMEIEALRLLEEQYKSLEGARVD